MQFQSEILRFQEGARSHHPSPEATIVAAHPGMLTDAGERIAVLVDLTPRLTYRSREIRTLTVKTYWASSGSIVARMRRALAAANRHLLQINSEAPPGSKCSGSISCAVFSYEELFLGQVGSAYAFILHPPGVFPRFEVFPRRERLLVPLGATNPPAINISYTVLEEGCSAFFATTLIAESQARELWQKALALPTIQDMTQAISQEMLLSKPSGSVILIKGLASEKPRVQLTGVQSHRQRTDETKQTQRTSAPSSTRHPSQQVQTSGQAKLPERLLAASMRQITSSVRDTKSTITPGPTGKQSTTQQVTTISAAGYGRSETEPTFTPSPKAQHQQQAYPFDTYCDP